MKLLWMKILTCLILLQPFFILVGTARDTSHRQSINHYDLTDQLIVKFWEPSRAREKASINEHAKDLSKVAGVALTFFRNMSGDSQVFRLPDKMPLAKVKAITKMLNTHPLVEHSEPDRLMFPLMVPNDPFYINQWHYKSFSAPDYEVGGVNLPEGWNMTIGSSSIVTAVIDTGLVPHGDIDNNILDGAGRVVPGYDFISDSLVANDGDGRDSDPSDPGDWITEAEDSSGYFAGCGFADSSWHGTHVAGTIGALSNNSTGVAGINWKSKILPVRVLGKCGGYTSDIVDGMRWAAGLSVAGVPENANPAKVLNLSLGRVGECSSTEQTAISDIMNAGTVVVAAAGSLIENKSNFSPASCDGVISVASVTRSGARAYYSNYGLTVKISAPGGEQSYPGDPNGILSTLNSGTTFPIASPAGDTYEYYQGTSMATSHVTGIASLMLSVNSTLTPPQVLQILKTTGRAFPTGTENDCTTSMCGAGIVDAYSAVQDANSIAPPVEVPVLAPEPSITPGTENTIYWGDVSDTVTRMDTGRTGDVPADITNGQANPELNAPQLSMQRVTEIPVRKENPQTEDFVLPAQVALNLEREIVQLDEGLVVLSPSVTTMTAPILFSENFEGDFPGSNWNLSPSPTWDETSYDKYEGSWSGWCGDSTLDPALGYVDNMNAWMVYGPFSLADATNASMSFWYKNLSETYYDHFYWMASVDGENFGGYMISGNQNSWRSQVFDFANNPILGDLRGQPQVWVAFGFTSDDSVSGPLYKGAYVDDIVITKETTVTPDLTVNRLPNWNDRIPVEIVQLSWNDEHSYMGPFYDDQILYFNRSALNQGDVSTAAYTIRAEVTGTGGDTWDWAGLTSTPGSITYLTYDQAVGPLAAGSHTFKVWADYYDAVEESNESNNYYEHTIIVLPRSVEYYAEYADNPDFISPISSGWVTHNQWTFSNLTPGQTYWYRIKARRGPYESIWSNIEYSQQELLVHTVEATGTGNGSGTIAGNLSGDVINASWNGEVLNGDRSAQVADGSGPYTLNAAAVIGSTVSWTSGCDSTSGKDTFTATCTLNAPVISDKFVTATFTCSMIYYLDSDNDGLGDPDDFIVACEPPTGYVTNHDDCDDTDPNIPLSGDISADGNIDISDAIIALQILSANSSVGDICKPADIDGDGKIGIHEAIYAIQVTAEIRP